MFRIVARLSRRARTMPRRSPLTSVMPALSIATSVPVPIAMPTSACASAGASLMPSPAIATTAARLLQPPDRVALLSGSTSAITSSMPSAARRQCAVDRAVAGQHDDAQAFLVQGCEAPRRWSP